MNIKRARRKPVKIGETEIERAKEAVRPLITFENEWRFKQQFPYYLTDPENLYPLKILPPADVGDFTFVDGNGNQFFVKPQPVSTKETVKSITPFDSPQIKPPLYLRNPEQYYWYEYLPDQRRSICIIAAAPICRRSRSTGSQRRCRTLWQELVERMVIDLRLNGGGNSIIFEPLIKALSRRREVNQSGRAVRADWPRDFPRPV